MARRLAAILAADVVGYSRLMAVDEKGTHARLKALRQDFLEPKVAEHKGRVVKLMGDGALVEFASVVDAVECAAAVQQGVAERQAALPEDQRIAFRIGINIGDIIIEDDDIYGDGVNVAARLEQLAEPGGICVSRTVYNHVKNKVAFGFEPMGEHRVKNIPEPVVAYRVLADPDSGGKAIGVKRARRPSRRGWVAAAAGAIVLVAAAGTAWWYRDRATEGPVEAAAALPLPDQPSIAVLPFDNLSGDPDQEYFADGITEDLITDLSKSSGLFVIARNSSFRYKDMAVDPEKVARELGVRYLLEGSVRRVGDQVRINAQLIDATTTGHVWAERYDGSLADVFALQDRVTQKIVDALAVSLTAREPRTRERAETAVPEAYDAFLEGWEHFRMRTPEHYAKALKYFQQAVELDPDYARAHAAIASVYWRSFAEGWTPMLGVGTYEAENAAAEHLERAMVEPTSLAHQVAAQMRLRKARYDDAIAAAEQGVALDPSDADSRAVLAEVLIYCGRPEEALAAIEAARRLDPHNAARYAYLEGFARFGLDQFDAAAQLLERALELGPDLWPPETTTYSEADCDPCELLLAVYGYLGGRDDEIQAMRDRLDATWGTVGININTVLAYRPFKEAGDRERFAEGLRRAGQPES
jgi:TolB-like protein/class 3 adenylate cyclase/Flp pilus assembly protein TadD